MEEEEKANNNNVITLDITMLLTITTKQNIIHGQIFNFLCERKATYPKFGLPTYKLKWKDLHAQFSVFGSITFSFKHCQRHNGPEG